MALIWKNDVWLELINFTANHIMVRVLEDDGFTWWLTCFYGWPEATQKHKSWELLSHLKSFVEGPWLCIGDFNAILQSSEKLSKRPAQVNQINAFRIVLEVCQLEDLGYRGYQYTWNNKRLGKANTKLRLDKAIATKAWREKFQLSTVTHLSPHASDHLPIILQTQNYRKTRFKGGRSFKFEEVWLLLEDCEDVVKDAWSVDGNDVHGLAMIKKKIEACGEVLRAWGSSKTKPNTEAIKQF